MLWPDRNEVQATNSLRTELSQLRRHLRDHADCMNIDRTNVALTDVSLAPFKRNRNVEFFEDAPLIGEEFEDWLRQERAYQGRNTSLTPVRSAEAAPEPEPQPNDAFVAIGPPVVNSTDQFGTVVAQALCDQMIADLRNQGLVKVIDLRDLTTDQTGIGEPSTHPTAIVTVRLTNAERFTHVSISAARPESRQILWNASISAEKDSNFVLSGDQVLEFVSQAVDSIQAAVFRKLDKQSKAPSLFTSIHHIMGMSVDGQRSARVQIKQHDVFQDSAMAQAWHALSIANSLGERDKLAMPDMLEEAEENCRRALELDASNPVVLALVAHVQGFLFRRLQFSDSLLSHARTRGKSLALVWDLSAMNALYRDQHGDAIKFAQRANALSRFSPYRPFFLSSLSICSAVAGDHKTAIRAGETVLARLPSFLGVRRHLVASYAATDDLATARENLDFVRRHDPTFNLSDIRGDTSNLPSQASRELIESALRRTGNNNLI